jgi:hypothetical protein
MSEETPDRETQPEKGPENAPGYEAPKADELPEDETAGTARGAVNGTVQA